MNIFNSILGVSEEKKKSGEEESLVLRHFKVMNIRLFDWV
jgi:hypothetical protein